MNNSIKVGDTCVLKKDIITYKCKFEQGSIVKITGINSKGYQFIGSNGIECINAGFNGFVKLIEEKTEPCKFCNNSGDYRYTYSDNNIRYFLNLFGNYFLRIGIENLVNISSINKPKVQTMEINYCPFCGRKLK